ncbi:MarR family winged helix-turn-helix transcriptional regulator [Devosia aurantiaca]|uniref:MarR family transcriptional regulator n=1 Tax=Devosia aurantiaca TaxID=2714858 RepID=A0A6M1SQC5_9HYPH|nr:MarR family transcriptional regulator [Devosia aurantiaca]NGP19350.1 MarR family transcriptional regulator [Devosia aurantiaca]
MSPSNSNLGWALTALLRDYLKQVDDSLKDLPGGSRGFMMLTAIAETDCQSQVVLAERLGLDRTTVTYLIDGLERENLLTRTPDPADRRARHINLTDHGAARLASLIKAVDAVEARVLSRLSGGEAEHFRHILIKAAGLAPDTAEMCQAAIETGELINAR